MTTRSIAPPAYDDHLIAFLKIGRFWHQVHDTVYLAGNFSHGKQRGIGDRHDLVVIACAYERRLVDALQVLGKVRFREGFDAIVVGPSSVNR